MPGQYIGLAKAQAAYSKTKEEALRFQAEKDVAEIVRRTQEKCASKGQAPSLHLRERRTRTFTRCLKEALASIRAAVAEMRGRTISDRMERLEAQNARLLAQVAELRREMEELRRQAYRPGEKDMRQLIEEVSRRNLEAFSTTLNARLAGIEDRLLPEPRQRPPIAAEKNGVSVAEAPKKKGLKPALPEATARPTYADVAADTPSSATATTRPLAPTDRRRKSKRPSMAAQEAAQQKEGATRSASPAGGPHTVAGPRKADKKKKKGVATPAKATPKQKKKRKKVKLRSPTTAAITLTLAADAAKRGVTYVSLLTQAKAAIDLGELGIPRLGFRLAENGARVLTIEGEGAQEKADAFAERLRAVLPAEVVKVARPVRSAEIRVAGLDDSAATADVNQASAAGSW
ncbi:Gag protein [Danaus plexippus plexippus]|uniref:Gag protein n=1 Tax=Danaus plexippus plexippus TaxID=278856 RepID=A0A212FAT7_DANPL|nr:Gag protein [Danaus plexippus plexippus]